MADWINWVALLAVLVMLAGAVAVLLLNNFLAAVAATSVVSLGAAVIFVLLRAPDVALTEAAVGAGLSSVIMALCLRRLGLWRIPSVTAGVDDEAGNS
ncbi:MAG TPA: hydrogenase subunit MbhD domain-containing protein [Gammaproteobacteria bacterium]|nr:hydrogenase subunit MbhD domain-containing protein [Gammaproteobacteria bacterium]